MIYKIETSHSIDIVKEEMEEKAKALGFGILKTYDFKQLLEEKGHPIEKNITVFELCNPIHAQEVLRSVPEISAFLPCRISVYEENQVTKLATIGLDDIVSALHTDKNFNEYMGILFINLKQIMHSWDD